MSHAMTVGVLLIAGWVAVIVGAITIYQLVRIIKPGFDKRLWRK